MSSGFTANVTGRVQGVGYRFFVLRAARGLGLRGYVRNLPDGSVEVAAVGNMADLQALASALEEGPPPSIVEGVGLRWSQLDVTGDTFEVRY